MSNAQDIVHRIVIPLICGAVIGAWAFATSRAGLDDLDRVEAKGEARETRLLSEMEKIEEKVSDVELRVHEAEVEQAGFRAQVRAALGITD